MPDALNMVGQLLDGIGAPTKVAYAVVAGEYSDFRVLAVYTTREAAESACTIEIEREFQTGFYAYCGDEYAQRRRIAEIVCVEEYPLDPPAEQLP